MRKSIYEPVSIAVLQFDTNDAIRTSGESVSERIVKDIEWVKDPWKEA